jgi:hypothetical protein
MVVVAFILTVLPRSVEISDLVRFKSDCGIFEVYYHLLRRWLRVRA